MASVPGLGFGFFLMEPNGLDNLLAHGIDGVQAGHRLLENHRDAVSANGAHPVFGEFEEVAFVEDDFAGDDFAGRVGNKPHNG